MRAHARLVAALVVVGLLPALAAHAEELMTYKDAAKRALEGAAKASKLTLSPTEDEKQALVSRGVSPEAQYVYLLGRDDSGSLKVAGIILDQEGKEGPMRVGVSLSPDGTVREAFLVALIEERGQGVKRSSFLDQFKGKGPAAALRVGQDVDGITGATASSEAVASAVRRAVVAYQVLVKGRGLDK